MRQDEKYTAVIVGIASDTAKLASIWEAFRKLFLDYADEVIEALTPVAEAMSIVIARVDHDGDAVFRVEEDIRYKFPDAADALVNAACVQGLEDLLTSEKTGHGFFLKL